MEAIDFTAAIGVSGGSDSSTRGMTSVRVLCRRTEVGQKGEEIKQWGKKQAGKKISAELVQIKARGAARDVKRRRKQYE